MMQYAASIFSLLGENVESIIYAWMFVICLVVYLYLFEWGWFNLSKNYEI